MEEHSPDWTPSAGVQAMEKAMHTVNGLISELSRSLPPYVFLLALPQVCRNCSELVCHRHCLPGR